jgi:hypothetical protein
VGGDGRHIYRAPAGPTLIEVEHRRSSRETPPRHTRRVRRRSHTDRACPNTRTARARKAPPRGRADRRGGGETPGRLSPARALEHCLSSTIGLPLEGRAPGRIQARVCSPPSRGDWREAPRVCWGRTLPGSPVLPARPFRAPPAPPVTSTPPRRPPPPRGIVDPDGSGCPLPRRDADWQGAVPQEKDQVACHRCPLKHYPGPNDGGLAANAP